jgi:predicted DNA-binding transcriptional regulator YafY
MYNPTTRLLTLLELLQARGRISGAELSDRLEVDARSVRRYVTMLQDIGIPITSERGRYGGYELRRGFKLPPLMFTEDEALALTLGLLSARRLGMAGAAPAIEGALAKIERVLPEAVRGNLQAVQETLTIDLPISGEGVAPASASLLAVSTGARHHRRVVIRYRSGSGDESAETERRLDPYGIVYRRGRWYTVGWCHLRRGVRVFRLDRVLSAQLSDEEFTPPSDFDAREHLLSSLSALWNDWLIEVVLRAPLEEARRWISPIVGQLEERPDGLLLTMRADSLDWAAHYLVGLPWSFEVVRPAELMDALTRLAERIDRLLPARV